MNSKNKTKEHKEPAAVKTTANAFSSAADALGGGIDALFAQSEDPEFLVHLDDVEIIGQVRTQMEDDEQDLAGLGDSLAKYQIQAIFLRIMPAGHPKPYRLVAGERRYRAAQLKGMTQLRAKARELTDEEAEDLQFAENTHRKNLTQIEEAKKVQHDLDRLGSVDAVLAKHNKSRGWLSKILALLTLPEQAKRLVTENVSADLEVINTVKTVEKVDPNKARELVDELKAGRGKVNARDKAQEVKEQVKPKKPSAAKPAKKDAGGSVATPRDRSQEDPSDGKVFAPAKIDAGVLGVLAVEDLLNKTFSNIVEFGAVPATVLEVWSYSEMASVEEWLYSFFEAGKQTKNISRAVVMGLRNGQFSLTGSGAFAMSAFLAGAEAGVKYDTLNVLGSVKP